MEEIIMKDIKVEDIEMEEIIIEDVKTEAKKIEAIKTEEIELIDLQKKVVDLFMNKIPKESILDKEDLFNSISSVKGDMKCFYSIKLKIDYMDLLNIIDVVSKETSIYRNIYIKNPDFFEGNFTNFYKGSELTDLKESFFKIQTEKHPYKYIFSKEKKENKNIFEIKVYKDRILKRGILLYCDECRNYEPAEIILDINFYVNKNDINLFYSFHGLECSECKKIHKEENLKMYRHKDLNSNYGLKSIDIFDNEDKVVISVVYKRLKCFLDQYRIDYISEKIVMNLKTGMSYRLPSYNLKTKKKEDHIRAISTDYIAGFCTNRIYISIEQLKQLINIMEEYYKKNNIKHIPYKDFTETINSNLTYKGEYILINLLDVLHYNQNPTMNKNSFTFVERFRSSIKKTNRMKKIRNYDTILNILFDYNEIKNKYHKSYIINNHLHVFTINNLKKEIVDIDNTVYDNNNKIKYFKSNVVNIKYILNSQFYKDLLTKYTENNITNAIVKICKEKGSTYVYDIAFAYAKLKAAMPEYEIPGKRLRLVDIHDKITSDARKLNSVNKKYIYEDKIHEIYNKKINGIEFKLATQRYDLIDIGSSMNICVGSYNCSVEDGLLIIVSMIEKGKYVGCLEISQINSLNQAKACRNKKLDNKYQEAVASYCKDAKIFINTNDMDPVYNNSNNNHRSSYMYNIEKTGLKDVIKLDKNSIASDTII